MPSRLAFKVIEASSEDDDFKALELNVQEATNKGWQSCRNAIFPQHIVLELESEARIKKLQILSHHYMISRRFEIQVGNLVNYQFNSKKIDFIQLGQVSLASHANTTCKVRELKSVHVDAVGKFVKLLFGEAHPDDLNVYKQVSIMAINVFGDYTSDEVNSFDAKNEETTRSTDYYYPSDDLSSLMYLDREVVHIIKQLEEMRKDKNGDFDELGSMISKLEQIGKVLLDLEMTRRMLVEFEDSKRLVAVGNKIAEMREAMHSLVQHLNVSTSLPTAITPSAVKIVGSNPGIHVVSIEPIFVTSTPRSLPTDDIKTPEHNNNNTVVHEFDPTSTPTSTCIPIKVVNQNAYNDYNERPLPTHRKGQGRKVEEVSDEEPTRDGESDSLVEELSEKDGKDATFVVETFGLECARQIFSKKWNHKLQGLDRVSKYFGECCNNSNSNNDENKKSLGSSDGMTSNVECPLHKVSMTNVTKAVEHVMIKVFKDNIISVFKAALLVYTDFLLKFVPAHNMPKLDLFLEHTLPPLLTRLADISSNLRSMTSSLVIELSKSSAFKYKTILMVECMRMTKHNSTSKMVLGVTELLFTIYLEQGLIDSGLTWDSLLAFLSECVSNSCSNVRKFAKDFLSRLLVNLGVSIRSQGPRNEQHNATIVMINKIKQMLSEFDSIDKKSKLEAMTPKSNVKLQDNVPKITSQVEPHKPLVQDKIIKQVTTEKKTTQSLQPTVKKPQKVTKENQPTLKTNVKQISNHALPTKPTIRKFSPQQRSSMPSLQTSKAEPTIATKQTASSCSQKSTSKQQQRLPSKQQLKAPTSKLQENKSKNARRRSVSFDRKTSQNRIDLPVIESEEFKGVKRTTSEDEGTCVFCGKEGVPFNEKVVDHHYFNECPMLVHCSHCKITLEVSDLSTHRMESCNQRSLFKKCPRCKRAILSSSYDEHVDIQCREVRNGEQACPICGDVVKDDQNSWKDHLTRPDGCRHRS